MTVDPDGHYNHESFSSYSYSDWNEESNHTTSGGHDVWSLRKAWKAVMREILAERAHIRRRGMAVWFYNDHLIFIAAVLLLVLVIATIVIGKIVLNRRERRLFKMMAVRSEDSFWYQLPIQGEPVTRKTALSPNLPKIMPVITISESSLCLNPRFTENTLQPPGTIEIHHQNLPKYMRPFYENSAVQTVISIPYTPMSFCRLTVDQPISRLQSPRPSASAPAIMSGLWSKLENVLRPKKDSDGEEDKQDLNTRVTRRSKSNEEVTVQPHHGSIYDDSYRQRYLCNDCRKMTCSHKTLGVAVCRSTNSLGFEGVHEAQWPSYMYPSRARYQDHSISTSLDNTARIPKLSTFPQQAIQHATFRVVDSRLGNIDGESSDESESE